MAHIMVRVKAVAEFDKLWDTANTNSRNTASIYLPLLSTDRTRLRLCLGHYASPRLEPPHRLKRPRSTCKESYLEFTDTQLSVWRLHRPALISSIVDRLLPPPVRLTQRWSKRFPLINKESPKGQRQLYAWEAVPPEGFVALGMICSTTESPPPVTSVRCVPLAWVQQSTFVPEKVWDDAGTSGTHGSIWVINQLRLIAVTPGHDAPEGPFYDLKWDHGLLSQLQGGGEQQQ